MGFRQVEIGMERPAVACCCSRSAADGKAVVMEKIQGGCLCGAVRFSASGPPKSVYWCHCSSCRKHSGAPVSVFVGFDRGAYSVTTGEIVEFASSAGTVRGFCQRCGSTLTCEVSALRGETHFHVGAFDEPERLQPGRHFFRNEQLPWLHLAD